MIAMEYFTRLLAALQKEKEFKYHPKCVKMKIIQMVFADDLLLFCKGDFQSVKHLTRCFEQFSMASGLQANLAKSSIYFGGVKDVVKDQILQGD